MRRTRGCYITHPEETQCCPHIYSEKQCWSKFTNRCHRVVSHSSRPYLFSLDKNYLHYYTFSVTFRGVKYRQARKAGRNADGWAHFSLSNFPTGEKCTWTCSTRVCTVGDFTVPWAWSFLFDSCYLSRMIFFSFLGINKWKRMGTTGFLSFSYFICEFSNKILDVPINVPTCYIALPYSIVCFKKYTYICIFLKTSL